MAADEVSERIRRAALARFVEVGFGSATIDEIAAGAEVGVASLYRRWPDKAALANELMVAYLDRVETALEPEDGGTAKSRFLALWRRLWDLAEGDPKLLVFVEAQAHDGFMTDEVAARKEATGQRWTEAMGEFGMKADAATATAILVGTMTAAWQMDVDTDREELGRRLWAALNLD